MISLPLADLLTFSNEFKLFFDAKPIELIAGDPASVCIPDQNITGYKITYVGNDPDGWMVIKNAQSCYMLLEIKEGAWKAYFPPHDQKGALLHMATMLKRRQLSCQEAWKRLRFLMRDAHAEAHKEKGNMNYLSDFLVDAYLSMDLNGFIEKRAKPC
jgi:hypothetical protein